MHLRLGDRQISVKIQFGLELKQFGVSWTFVPGTHLGPLAHLGTGPIGPIGPRTHVLSFREGQRLFLQSMYTQIYIQPEHMHQQKTVFKIKMSTICNLQICTFAYCMRYFSEGWWGVATIRLWVGLARCISPGTFCGINWLYWASIDVL